MTFEEKVPYMIKWWEQAHEAMIAQKMTRQGKKKCRGDDIMEISSRRFEWKLILLGWLYRHYQHGRPIQH